MNASELLGQNKGALKRAAKYFASIVVGSDVHCLLHSPSSQSIPIRIFLWYYKASHHHHFNCNNLLPSNMVNYSCAAKHLCAFNQTPITRPWMWSVRSRSSPSRIRFWPRIVITLRIKDSKAIILFRLRENLRHDMKAKKDLGKKVNQSLLSRGVTVFVCMCLALVEVTVVWLSCRFGI